MSDSNAHPRSTPIAIIGLGALMPEAHNLREFWENIVGKVDCITDVPPSRWNPDDYYDPDPTAEDKTYNKRGGFIPDVVFDPLEFGLPPNILEATDASQLLSLLVAKEALLDAGYYQGAEALRDKTGVILGVCSGQKLITPLSARLQYPIWNEVLESYGIGEADRARIIERMKLAYVGWEENSFPGLLGNVISGRIANRFDLGGTNCSVDAACASTMAALKMAVAELSSGSADMMIAGGVDTDNSIFTYLCFSKTPAFSKGTHPRPFDEASDGMMVGEGIGMMVLKRLADAERDGDRIYAVIKGMGSSSDGRFKSIYAPRGEGQERALVRAYEDADISPATIGLVEAHGTGTVAGDSTEVSTIIRFFGQHDDQKQHIAIGSVKSQIGHTKASAGAAGLIKAALALHHKVLPPTRNVDNPNPKYDMPSSAFYVNGDSRPWIVTKGTPRRAGVSSFGFGGTNFHVVMEEYVPEHGGAYRVHHTAQGVVLQGATVADLDAAVTRAIETLRGDATQFLNFVREAATLPLTPNAARVGFVALNAEEAIGFLQITHDMLTAKPTADEWQHPKGVFFRRNGLDLNGKVVALFSGQGAQYQDMGRELALNFPEVRTTFARVDAVMARKGKPSLSDVVYPRTAYSEAEKRAQADALQDTTYAQPAIGAVSAGLYRLMARAGFRPNFTAGHSFGEVSALWAAGVLNDDDYDTLIEARGAAMAPPANDPNFDAGTMLAVVGDVDAIEAEVAALTGVSVANRNSYSQVVLAGSQSAIAQAETVLKAKNFKVTALAVSAAFHTPLVGHAQKPFADAIYGVRFNAPQIPVFSNETGAAYPNDPTAIQRTLAAHLLKPVRFTDEIESIYAAGGTVFVEFGPRNILTNLVKDILGARPHVAVALNGSRQKDSDRQLREAAVQLQVLGMNLSALDPYAQIEETILKKKGMAVTLNAASYVSDKTRAAYQQALQSGGSVTLMPTANVTPVTLMPVTPTPIAPPAIETPKPVERPMTPVTQAAPTVAPEVLSPRPMPNQTEQAPDMTHATTLENGLEVFREHQRETLRAHEQFAQSQAEYFRIFFELTKQQQTLMTSQALPAATFDTLAQNMMRFHEYQSETLRLHEHYMRQQTDIAQSLLAMVGPGGVSAAPMPMPNASVQPGPAAPAPRPQTPPPAPAPVQRLVQVVDAAPQPVVSVPPVAANGHVESARPVTATPPAPLQPVTPVQSAPTQPAPIHPTPVQAAPASVVIAPPAPVTVASGPSMAALSEAMLRIVGDKTGYPVEMLELGMDMEADLGIDSIKRVEILGAMREDFPELPQFSPEELGELRTLQQIVDYMRERSGGTAAPVAIETAPANATLVAPTPVVQTPVAPAPASTNGHANGQSPVIESSGPDLAALSEAMLRIVGDKTGYPVEMLELGMDMEADLGIDSIKRVEILGAMREDFPELPQFSPEELGELRTLQQIVDYMKEASRLRTAAPFDLMGSAATEDGVMLSMTHNQVNAVLPLEPLPGAHGIGRHIVELRRINPPDHQDVVVDGAVCLVMDDGSLTASALAAALGAAGWRVVQVKPNDLSESAIVSTIAEVTARHGAIGTYVGLAAQGRNADAEKAFVKFNFLMAKHLKPHLTRGGAGRQAFLVVTRLDGALGTVSADASVTGGLYGLVKTLALEWPGVFCRAIDLAPTMTADAAAQAVAAELYDPDRLLTEVAYDGTGRYTLAAREVTDDMLALDGVR